MYQNDQLNHRDRRITMFQLLKRLFAGTVWRCRHCHKYRRTWWGFIKSPWSILKALDTWIHGANVEPATCESCAEEIKRAAVAARNPTSG